jgi:hypothetical protein
MDFDLLTVEALDFDLVVPHPPMMNEPAIRARANRNTFFMLRSINVN